MSELTTLRRKYFRALAALHEYIDREFPVGTIVQVGTGQHWVWGIVHRIVDFEVSVRFENGHVWNKDPILLRKPDAVPERVVKLFS